MYQCAVVNCPNQYSKIEENVTYHCFPANDDDRKKWLSKCGRDENFDYSQFRVCSRHFSVDDFVWILQKETAGQPLKKHLKMFVVPNLNLVNIKLEPPDADEVEDDHMSTRPNVSSCQSSVTIKEELDNSHFVNGAITEANLNTEATPVEPIYVVDAPKSPNIHYIPSSLPASQNWPGEYSFTVSFGPQEKTTKGVSWTYSKVKDKLYVGRDVPCPVNFSANAFLPTDVCIRVMALYSSPEHASEIVTRCINHAMDEVANGLVEAQHLVRCESKMATYEIDKTTKRHSTVVPFENPPVGQKYSTYIYKFACFGSCAGGPNRRPLMLIFSLEKNGQVIGRRKMDVKICACPGRDRKAEEKMLMEFDEGRTMSLKRKESEQINLSEVLNFTKSITLPSTKKTKHSHNGIYNITVDDKDCYDFLKQMRKFYEMCKTMKNLPPHIQKFLVNHSRRKHHGHGQDSS